MKCLFTELKRRNNTESSIWDQNFSMTFATFYFYFLEKNRFFAYIKISSLHMAMMIARERKKSSWGMKINNHHHHKCARSLFCIFRLIHHLSEEASRPRSVLNSGATSEQKLFKVKNYIWRGVFLSKERCTYKKF